MLDTFSVGERLACELHDRLDLPFEEIATSWEAGGDDDAPGKQIGLPPLS